MLSLSPVARKLLVNIYADHGAHENALDCSPEVLEELLTAGLVVREFYATFVFLRLTVAGALLAAEIADRV